MGGGAKTRLLYNEGCFEIMKPNLENLTDEQILALVCEKGQTEAFAALVKRYQKRLYAVARGILREADAAEEAVQETFLKAYKSLDSFKGVGGFYSWIFRIHHNICIDRIRERGKAKVSEFDELLPDNSEQSLSEALGCFKEDPFESASRAQISERIAEAMEKLSEQYRAIIILREVEEMSYKEISEILGIGMGTVMSRLFYARRELQKLLSGKV